MKFPCPRSRQRIWSRETGSAVPSGVSLLILRTQAESCAYSRDSSSTGARLATHIYRVHMLYYLIFVHVLLGCLRKSQLGFGFGLFIVPKTETQWIFRKFGLLQCRIAPKRPEERPILVWHSIVLLENSCLLAYTPRNHLDIRRTSVYNIVARVV